MKIALIVIPTYNEAGTIEQLIIDIFKLQSKVSNWQIQILINDSHSTDKTNKLIKKLQKKYSTTLHLIETEKQGLGKAYHQAFTYAIDKINPYVIFQMDADYSHDPKSIPSFLKKIETGSDMVIGARYIKNGSIPKNWGVHRKLFSICGNLIVRFGFMKLNIHDWTSGYRAIKIWVIKDALNFIKNYSGYVFQIAFLDQAVKKNAIISEVPIQFTDRRYGKSKILFSQYIFQILFYLLSYSSFIKFVIVGGIGFIIDFGISYLGINILKSSVVLTTIISTETAIISNFLLNNFWSFAHKKLEGSTKSLLFNFLKFNLVSSGSIIIQTLGVSLLSNIFGSQFWYVYKILIIALIIIPYSYILYNKIIWKKK